MGPDESEVAPTSLLAFDGFKQGFEVAFPEALRSAAANDFEEQRGSILQRLGEQLQQVPLVVSIHQDAEIRDLLVILFDVPTQRFHSFQTRRSTTEAP